MLNPIFTDESNAILVNRLARISQELRDITLSTAEDYQAEVYSDVNAVLDIGEAVTPLKQVGAQGPAVVGDINDNYTILNNDAEDIAAEIEAVEDATATLFNLAASTQNQLRQQIREALYASNKQLFQEDFVNNKQVSASTAAIDFNAGVATNALLDETTLSPMFSSGPNSVGKLAAGSSLSNLSSGVVGTAMTWNGSTLELVLTFATPQIANRLYVNMDNYQELEIDTFTTTPDGTKVDDVLEDLGVTNILLNSTSNKFSGDVIVDFPPRYCQTIRIILFDRVGQGNITLRGLSVSARRYQPTGQLTSVAINHPTGTVNLSVDSQVFAPYVQITHQISYDGTTFTAVTPGVAIALQQSPFYYRALLSTNTSAFTQVNTQGPLNQSPLDPVGSANYTLATTTTVPLGNGVVERTLLINSITGPIVLRDQAIPNSVVVQVGSVILDPTDGSYSFSNGTLTFPSPISGVTLSYQTSSLGPVANKDLQPYYTALLYEYQFEA